jgi:hypothetical protein
MTPDQVKELRQDAARLTTALGPLMLRRLGPSGSLIRASLRALGLDLATLAQSDPLDGVPDEAVATLATLLHRRLSELGAGGPAPSEDQRAAALLAIIGPPE